MGMVVRTNTMALNAYRQLGMNNNAVAKSLEKLASGYRINRAGDDAAGLAISEKMKAQITGLETASANAQDGISLIQTAEGNLSEVHDMLNRMVELSSKSANGTYTVTERQALQDEMDQLLDEIDRISQSANFNGTKLLDGSMSGGVKVANAKDVITDNDILTDGQLSTTPQPGIYSVDFSNASITNTKTGAGTAAKFEDDTANKTTGATTNILAGLDFSTDTAKLDATALGKVPAKVTVDGVDVDLTTVKAGFTTDTTYADAKTAILGAISTALGDKNTAGAAGKADYTKYGTATATDNSGDGLTITYDKTPVKYTAATAGDAEINTDVKFSIFGQDLVLGGATGVAAGATLEGADLAKAVAAAWNDLTDAQKKMDDTTLEATVEGSKVIFTQKTAPTSHTDITAATGTFENSTDVMQNNGHEVTVTVVQEPAGKTGRLYGQAKMDLSTIDIQDGTTLKIGDTTYVFAVGANSKYKNSDNAVDLTHREVGADDITEEAAKRLSTAAADNKNFKVGTTTIDGIITFTEREGGVDYSKNNLAGSDHKGTSDVASPSGDPDGTKNAKATDWKGLIQVGMVDTSSGSKALTLQIGDTADSYNKMSVSVADMSAKGLGLAALKKTGIMTEEDASNAIDTIKTAINTVSSTRAGLGALQNRLEHTINNLDVAAENLSAANSRIRDTDMAKEMMNYTKMNVLVQSAQAMLAQANQQPQSVLQLLQ